MIRTPLFLLSLLLPVAAVADEPPSILLGAGLWSHPAYDGADSNRTMLIPVVRYYGHPWFARTTFGMLEGGARLPLASGLTLGAQLAYEGGRDRNDSPFLAEHNISNFAPSASVGAHLEYEKNIGPMPFIALLRYRQDVDSERGAQTDLRLTAGIYGGEQSQFNAGIFWQTTWASAQAMHYYYGLTSQQAASAALPAYSADGGPLVNMAGLLWSYEVSREWMVLGSLETHRLRDAALASPLTQTDISHYASVGLAYQFR